MNSRTFALLVAAGRARLDLTRDELAERVGLRGNGSIVEAFEDGIAIPTPEVLGRLADELGWSEAEVAPFLKESRRGLQRATDGQLPGDHQLEQVGPMFLQTAVASTPSVSGRAL